MPCAMLPICANNRAKISNNLANKGLCMERTLTKCRVSVNEFPNSNFQALFTLLFTLQDIRRGKRPGARDGQDVGVLGDVRRQGCIGSGKSDDAHRCRIEQALA
jgi:hypothetical protein